MARTSYNDNVCFILAQHAQLDFYSSSSLTQQSTHRHVVPFFPSLKVNQSLFSLLDAICLAKSSPHNEMLTLLDVQACEKGFFTGPNRI